MKIFLKSKSKYCSPFLIYLVQKEKKIKMMYGKSVYALRARKTESIKSHKNISLLKIQFNFNWKPRSHGTHCIVYTLSKLIKPKQ